MQKPVFLIPVPVKVVTCKEGNAFEHLIEKPGKTSSFSPQISRLRKPSPEVWPGANKGTHDLNINLHSTLASQNTGKHCNTLFGKSVRQIF